jgi:methionyl aminopeptidase
VSRGSDAPAIHVKRPQDIEKMAASGRILAACLSHLAGWITPGMTTNDIDVEAETFIRGHGCIPGFIGYHGFPSSICVSVNEEVVHGMPGKRVLRDGDLVSLDCGLILDGWWADSGLSVGLGSVSEETERLLDVTRTALDIGIEKARAGNHIGDIGAAVQRHVESQGFSIVRNYVGHGIGRNMHERPQVPNYGEPGTLNVIKPGYVLAIEPMVNAGGHQVRELADGWTVVTVDGRRSCYFEHTVAVTESGPLVLTAREGEGRPAAQIHPAPAAIQA